MLAAAILPMGSGCSSAWYHRSADRAVARIVEERKVQTLGYSPQSQLPATLAPKPGRRAYEPIPLTQISPGATAAILPQSLDWTPRPMGPELPSGEEEIYDFVPPSYAAFGISMDPLGPPSPGLVSLDLDLLGAISYAVTHARDYQDRMEDLYLTALELTLQRHLFEPRAFMTTEVNYSGNQAEGDVRYKSAGEVIHRAGVRQQLPYGGTITAEQLITLTEAFNSNSEDGQSAESAISASIPLLRSAGLVNLEPLVSAERELVYQVRAFEQFRRSFAVNIASRFFQLVNQQQAINNRQQNYQNLKLLSERSLALYAAGRLRFLDVQRALQNQLNAENSLIDSINNYQASLDSFKILVGMPVQADMRIIPVALEAITPDLDNVDAAALAVKYRLDLQTSRDRIDDSRRAASNAKNQLLPDLTLSARSGVGNPDGTDWYRYDGDTLNYSAGVNLDWPVDRIQERNSYRRALIEFERSTRRYVQQRDQVIADVRQVVRSIRVALVTLEIQKRSVELNRRRLELANERLIQGQAQVLDVVDAQSALLNAQDAYDRARANLQTQVLNYLRDTGTIRLDPQASVLARAMDRQAVLETQGDLFEAMNQQIRQMEDEFR